MIVLACVDDQGGLMFGSRRQSKDRVLRAHILDACEGRTLWMSTYSAAQFEEDAPFICVDDDYAEKVKTGDACFIENGDFPKVLPQTLILYHWNRRYPADRFFPFDPLQVGYRLITTEEFVGSSHENITVKRYEKE